MLKLRVVTAAVLVFIVLAAIYVLPAGYFAFFLSVVILVGAWEWGQLAGMQSRTGRLGYLALLSVILLLCAHYFDAILNPILVVGAAWWLFALVPILLYPRYSQFWGNTPLLGIVGILVLIPAWMGIVFLRSQPQFPTLILMLFAIVATADIGAYFSGRAWGRHKLASAISPNKTWEGFWGGLLACSLLLVLAGLVYSSKQQTLTLAAWALLLVFGLVLAVASVIGDLLESLVKRLRGVKDSGAMLPGHGGILDRIDSITAAVPFYALLILYMG
ncbi:MAG: phosphatidate cytidylyltransferase [Pseudomonadales bacterium]|nr:phosphatidate cytidylyltransferase [Pseudomonadales bacterium]